MTALQGLGLFILAYLVLLGRNAWKQGELTQYLRALAAVLALVGLIAGGVLLYGNLFGT